MGTISEPVLQYMERFRQKHMKLDELTHPGWQDTVNHFCDRDKNCGTLKLRVLAVVEQHADDNSAAPAPTTFGQLIQCLDIAPGISHMRQGTFDQEVFISG